MLYYKINLSTQLKCDGMPDTILFCVTKRVYTQCDSRIFLFCAATPRPFLWA